MQKNRPSTSKDNPLADIAEAESSSHFGHVQRELKARHITFLALGGNLGTGLFLGIGHGLRETGPLSLFLGYLTASTAGFMMMMALGEMAAWLPVPGAIPQFCTRYVDEALGFAVGWNTWFTAVITLCAEISAACSIIQFWSGADEVNVAVWIVVLIALMLLLNILAVSIFGEFEFVCACLKLCGIIGLLIVALCIDLGGVPGQPRLGFHYWKTDGVMKEYIADGAEGRFLGFFYTLVNAQFAINGCETVVVAAGEAENPRRTIPKAIRRVFWRLLFFYVFAALGLGMVCPSNSPNLMGGDGSSKAQSPWVIAVNLAGIKALPSIINSLILIAAVSSGNSYVFMGTRYLYALASANQAPQIFLRCTGKGIPIWSLLVTMSISLLSFMSMGSSSSTAFQWFQNLATVATLYDFPQSRYEYKLLMLLCQVHLVLNLRCLYPLPRGIESPERRPSIFAVHIFTPTVFDVHNPGIPLYRGHLQWIRLHCRRMEYSRLCHVLYWISSLLRIHTVLETLQEDAMDSIQRSRSFQWEGRAGRGGVAAETGQELYRGFLAASRLLTGYGPFALESRCIYFSVAKYAAAWHP